MAQDEIIYKLIKISTDALILIETNYKEKSYSHVVEKLNKIMFLSRDTIAEKNRIIFDLFDIAFSSVLLAQGIIGNDYAQITTLVMELSLLVELEAALL
jgi:hypothetical protein